MEALPSVQACPGTETAVAPFAAPWFLGVSRLRGDQVWAQSKVRAVHLEGREKVLKG